jgi:hypothetical protein
MIYVFHRISILEILSEYSNYLTSSLPEISDPSDNRTRDKHGWASLIFHVSSMPLLYRAMFVQPSLIHLKE